MLRIAFKSKTMVLVCVLLVLALGYWLWFGLTQKSVTTDEGISILAAQGILEHGYPRIPSGFIYYRGLVPTYLVAGSIGVLGLNDLAIMLPSLLFALGSLFLAFLFARDVFRSPLVGVLSIVLLLALDAETFYATSPRMYMALQFFTILAAYGAWRGFVRGSRSFQWIAIFAVAGACLTHLQAGALLVAIPASVLVIRWLQGDDRPAINYYLAGFGMLFLWILYAILLFYPLPDRIVPIAATGGVDPGHFGLNLAIFPWLRHIGWLERTVPFGLVFAPVLVILGYKSIRQRRSESSRGFLFGLIFFSICALSVLALIGTSQVRIWLFALPVYVPLLWISFVAATQWVWAKKEAGLSKTWRSLTLAGTASVIWIAAIFAVAHFAYSQSTYLDIVNNGFGAPCQSPLTDCSKTVGEHYARLAPLVMEEDIVVSSNPWVTSYYLGKVDYFLRERISAEGFTEFDSPTDEYFGIPLLDTLREIRDLKQSDQKVWVVADFKTRLFLSESSLDLIKDTYVKRGGNRLITLYTNR